MQNVPCVSTPLLKTIGRWRAGARPVNSIALYSAAAGAGAGAGAAAAAGAGAGAAVFCVYFPGRFDGTNPGCTACDTFRSPVGE